MKFMVDIKNNSFKFQNPAILLLIAYLSLSLNIHAQTSESNKWRASWITVPDISETDYGVYLFRKNFVIENLPDSFIVLVSADNQFKLYINETLVSFGPSKSDIEHWKYESVDLAPFLKIGNNVVAAKVWNAGALKAEAQISLKTGFILQGSTKASELVDTNESWKCEQDSSYQPIRIGAYGMGEVNVRGYYVAGPGEKIDMQKKIKEWKALSFDDSRWRNAKTVFKRRSGFSFGGATEKKWNLVASIVPPMEMTNQRLSEVRQTEGVSIPEDFPEEKSAIQVPGNTTAVLLLDQKFLTTAFPTLILSGGNKSTVTLTYAESLYDGNEKGNRDEVEGKTIIGTEDIVISDGTENQLFTSLTFRTFRYVQLKVETLDAPLIINDFYGTYTGYPFQLKAKLETNDDELLKIFEIGWRSARLCAHDTYMDTPFYEQLQYIGDTRIQALVSLFNSGDDRLVKNALNLMDYSRRRDGVTLSRYPTGSENQIIPPFSLFYVGMLHDYMMYGSGLDFIKNKLPGTRQVMNYFIGLQDSDGSLKDIPDWNFTDWAAGWTRGIPPLGKDGCSAVLDLQFLMGLQAAADLENNLGRSEFGKLYKQLADKLAKTIQEKYWDSTKKLYADTSEKDKFSQHANTLAILTGLVKGEELKEMGSKLLSEQDLTRASIYFKYYLHQALVKAGLGNDYVNWLGIWRKNIELGLTTWGEDSNVETTRSDCHAWGASPNIEFFRTILGINSNAPGFNKVKIEPHLGTIKEIGGVMPHPEGSISVNYSYENENWDIVLTLPESVDGVFIWENKSYALKSGVNHFQF